MTFFAQLENLIRSQDCSCSGSGDVLAKQGCPSTSIAILDHGDITSRCISTLRDDEETVFQACSISKPVTGVAAIKLVQQGMLRLDGPITEYLPPPVLKLLETPKTNRLLHHVTIKHLLSHTPGLSVHGFPGYSGNPPNAEAVLAGDAPANTCHVCLEGLPGHQFSYSGGGMTVLQIIMETVTGKAFPLLMRELVFKPLGMNKSSYRPPDDDGNHATAYYTGYTPCDDLYRTNPEQAAAGLWTTPTDLLKVVRAVQRSLDTNDGSGFLHQPLARQMLAEVSSGMALSWFAPVNPGVAFAHGGSNEPGWRCFLVGYADLTSTRTAADVELRRDSVPGNSGICVMTNSAAGDKVIMKAVSAIAYLKDWTAVPHIYGQPEAMIPFSAPDVNVDGRWKEWQGRWHDEWEVGDADGLPYVRYRGLPPVRLVPAAQPSRTYMEGESIDLVLDGLEMMFRLGWKNGRRVVEVWQGGTGNITVLEK